MTDDGLLFRSRAEIMLYRAFKTLGIAVAVAPLPVFIRGGPSTSASSPTSSSSTVALRWWLKSTAKTYATPATAQDRLEMLSLEGVETYRVNAAECAVKAKACAEKILAVIHKTEVFSTASDGQTQVKITMYRGPGAHRGSK